MSEKIKLDDVSDHIEELGNDWRNAPWDRKVTKIEYITHGRYENNRLGKWDDWNVGLYIDNKECRTSVRITEDGELILWGAPSSFAGQVQNYARRVALMTLLVSSELFIEKLKCLEHE